MIPLLPSFLSLFWNFGFLFAWSIFFVFYFYFSTHFPNRVPSIFAGHVLTIFRYLVFSTIIYESCLPWIIYEKLHKKWPQWSKKETFKNSDFFTDSRNAKLTKVWHFWSRVVFEIRDTFFAFLLQFCSFPYSFPLSHEHIFFCSYVPHLPFWSSLLHHLNLMRCANAMTPTLLFSY